MADVPIWTKFAVAGLGGASGWMFCHPFDVVKVRMQISAQPGMNLLSGLKMVHANEGVPGLYSGLSAALTRQFTYTTSRIGLYDVIRTRLTEPGQDMSLGKKLSIGVMSGGIAATVCCPVEVSLVRMQADGVASAAEKRGYKHVFDALYRIATEEGVRALWSGAAPTVARGAVVSMSQISTYDHCKTMLKSSGMKDGVPTHLTASTISAIIYCTASLPLDITKTRMQNQRPLPDGSMPYKSMLHALVQIPRSEGVLALWRGYIPYFARGGGHTITMFLFVEQYKKMFAKAYA